MKKLQILSKLNAVLAALVRQVFKKHLEEELRKLALNEYIEKNFFLAAGYDGISLKFKGEKLVQHIGACFWELVKEADNYVECSLVAPQGQRLLVTIKKCSGMSPHEKMLKYEEENKKLKEELDGLRNIERRKED